jgi:hypothetical protein
MDIQDIQDEKGLGVWEWLSLQRAGRHGGPTGLAI